MSEARAAMVEDVFKHSVDGLRVLPVRIGRWPNGHHRRDRATGADAVEHVADMLQNKHGPSIKVFREP